MRPEQALERARMAIADIGLDPMLFTHVDENGVLRRWGLDAEIAWRAAAFTDDPGDHICWSCREWVRQFSHSGAALRSARDACLAPAPLMADCGVIR